MEQLLHIADTADMWKHSAVEEGMSDVETQEMSEARSSNSEDYQEDPEQQGDVECAFDGVWSKASIYNRVLTWHEGPWDAPCAAVTIDVVSATRFHMIYKGENHCAELQGDGQLHWDDGAIWIRHQAKFEGKWNKAGISKNTLTWNEGEEVAICVLSDTTFRMKYVGRIYTAELREDGRLQWDDGDVWFPLASELPPWLFQRRRVGRISAATVRDKTCNRADSQRNPCNIAEQKPCISRPSTRFSEEKLTGDPATVVVSAHGRNTHEEGSAHYEVSTEMNILGADSNATRSQSRARTPMTLTPIDTTVYHGVVKWFRGSYGWLVCDAIAADYPDCDVLAHKSECSFKPRQGDRVCFRLALNAQGNPHAMGIVMESKSH